MPHPFVRTRLPLAIPLLAVVLAACDRDRPASDPPPSLPQPPAAAASDPATFGHELGSVMAGVTVIEFSDFGCPYCARFAQEVFPPLQQEFIEAGQVRWIYIPVLMGFPNGEPAARSAQCAGDQGRFWPMHDLLYERQAEWREEPAASAEALFARYSEEVGLNATQFGACYRENHPEQVTQLRAAIAAQVGLRGTPSFIVGEQMIEGFLPLERFREVLAQAVSATSP